MKPKVHLVGEDSNTFNLAGIAGAALKRAGQRKEALEMYDRVVHAGSPEQALCIILEYVDEASFDDDTDEDNELEL